MSKLNANLAVRKAVSGAVDLDVAVWLAVDGAVWRAVDGAVWRAVGDAVYRVAYKAVNDAVRGAVWRAVGEDSGPPGLQGFLSEIGES